MSRPRLAKPPKVYESSVVSACIEWLYKRGCFVWRNNTGAYKPENSSAYVRYGYKGSADILGITPKGGRLVAIECKGTGGKVSDAQLEFGLKINRLGGIYIVAYSVDDLEKRRDELV